MNYPKSIHPHEAPPPARRNAHNSVKPESDQVKNLDWRERHAEFICTLDAQLLDDVVDKAFALLNPEEEDEEI